MLVPDIVGERFVVVVLQHQAHTGPVGEVQILLPAEEIGGVAKSSAVVRSPSAAAHHTAFLQVHKAPDRLLGPSCYSQVVTCYAPSSVAGMRAEPKLVAAVPFAAVPSAATCYADASAADASVAVAFVVVAFVVAASYVAVAFAAAAFAAVPPFAEPFVAVAFAVDKP